VSAIPSGRTRHLGYRAQQVLGYVERTYARDGIAPSYSMIRDELGMYSKSNVQRTIESLERQGLLRRAGSGRVRRIRLA
jgi:SOS-response transcriptional repressor LexA